MLTFYELNSNILNDPVHKKLNIAYGCYTVAKDNDLQRLKTLYKDAIIIAKNEGFDVFNITEVMQHKTVVDDLLFKVGDGKL